MKKICLPFLLCGLLLGGTMVTHAQFTRYLVVLRDKNQTPYRLDQPQDFLSPRALQRRISQHLRLDSTDLPINPAYRAAVAALPGVTILNTSKWLNQVLVKISDTTVLPALQSLPFVQALRPIAARSRPFPPTLKDSVRVDRAPSLKFGQARDQSSSSQQMATAEGLEGNTLRYGSAFDQIHIHHGEFLHNLGYQGQGMVISILDAGWQSYQSNPAFDSLRANGQILGTYDYVNLKQSVNEENIHGAFCLSILAANEPGLLVGSAPRAQYWLLKTEDVFSEYPVEEQNWVAGVEFSDSAGADLITTSLGYDYFDNPVFNQPYSQRDGHSTFISQAANLAVAKGMILTVSAGNSGLDTGEYKYISCPADADSVLTIGATDIHGQIAPFSSWGPNAAGILKPNVVSVGSGTAVALPTGQPAFGDGTSFSNPNLAGLIACLWQAFPQSSNREILQAVQQSADRFQTPDYRYGYGLPDFSMAYALLAEARVQRRLDSVGVAGGMIVYPIPFQSMVTVVLRPAHSGNGRLELLSPLGQILEDQPLSVLAGQDQTLSLPGLGNLAAGVYLLRYRDGEGQFTVKVIKR